MSCNKRDNCHVSSVVLYFENKIGQISRRPWMGNMTQNKDISTRSDDSKPSNWPVSFYVCSNHKESFYSDYDYAIRDDSKCCELCEPCDNDSLGG